jgi:hypothetical protein
MKLTELEPRWLEHDGRKVGMLLRCPHCRKTWLSCMFEAGIPVVCHRSGKPVTQFELFQTNLGEEPYDVVPCSTVCKWDRNGDDFSTMTVTPSLDASASGHWHGTITNGEVKP